MFIAFRRLLRPVGVVSSVGLKFGFILPDGQTAKEKNVLVPALVPELVGRDVDFTIGERPAGKPARAMGVQICDKARSKGRIVKYNVAQGHGSLTTTDGTLCVFRDTEIADFAGLLPKLRVGDPVEFDLTDGRQGPIATHLRARRI